MELPVAVIDTGLRGARANIALDAALVEAHGQGLIGDTIRLLRFPRSALVGRHQVLERELDLDWCGANGVEVARRITGGGAIVFEPAHLGWELVVRRDRMSGDLAAVASLICDAVARGLAALGINARFRPRNDIEVDGRKLCGSGGFYDGPTLFYQGTVLIDLDLDLLGSALRLPMAKAERHHLNRIADRVTTLARLLGEPPPVARVADLVVEALASCLGREPRREAPPDVLESLAARVCADEIGTDAFVAGEAPRGDTLGVLSGQRGSVRAHLRLRPGSEPVLQDVWFEGDFFLAPPRAVGDLEASLRDVAVPAVPARIAAFFAGTSGLTALGVGPAEFAGAVASAAAGRAGGSPP
jgi:lipoate---protein ligase